MAAVKKPLEPKFMLLGRGKYVHVVHTKAFDMKKSECLQVRKGHIAGKFKGSGISPEAALALDCCESCNTKAIAQSLASTETKRDESRDKRNETLAKMRPKTKTKVARAPKESKPKVKRDPRPTKSGPRSIASGSGDPGKDKAELLIAFSKEHDWDSKMVFDKAMSSWLVTSTRGNETITCTFTDGKYDPSHPAAVTVGTWSGKLRGVHGVRNQMAMEGRDKPHPEPGRGRSGPRKSKNKETEGDVVPEDESPEDASKRVPFSYDDDEVEIIVVIQGKAIRWRNGQFNTVMQARIPAQSKRTRITEHAKTGRRILSFLEVVDLDHGHEVLGPERNIALDKIIRVVE